MNQVMTVRIIPGFLLSLPPPPPPPPSQWFINTINEVSYHWGAWNLIAYSAINLTSLSPYVSGSVAGSDGGGAYVEPVYRLTVWHCLALPWISLSVWHFLVMPNSPILSKHSITLSGVLSHTVSSNSRGFGEVDRVWRLVILYLFTR